MDYLAFISIYIHFKSQFRNEWRLVISFDIVKPTIPRLEVVPHFHLRFRLDGFITRTNNDTGTPLDLTHFRRPF